METGGGDCSGRGSVMEGEEREKIEDQHRCQPHPELQGQKIRQYYIVGYYLIGL